MMKYALKFPKIARSFQALAAVFIAEIGDLEGNCNCEQLGRILRALGQDVSAEEVKILFQLANLDADAGIDFKEFLITTAIHYFIEKEEQRRSSCIAMGLPENANIEINEPARAPRALGGLVAGSHMSQAKEGFQCIREIFKAIDTDGSGTLTMEEVEQAFFEIAPNKEVIKDRMAELDFNDDGCIDFPEFMYGLASWVGYDEDDIEEAKKRAIKNKSRVEKRSKSRDRGSTDSPTSRDSKISSKSLKAMSISKCASEPESFHTVVPKGKAEEKGKPDQLSRRASVVEYRQDLKAALTRPNYKGQTSFSRSIRVSKATYTAEKEVTKKSVERETGGQEPGSETTDKKPEVEKISSNLLSLGAQMSPRQSVGLFVVKDQGGNDHLMI